MSEKKLERVAECLYRNHKGVYFALVKVGGKQIKRSLKTNDQALAKRQLKAFRTKTEKMGKGQRDLGFNELCQLWLESIKPGLKASSYARRRTSVNQLMPFFRNAMVRSISADDVDRWKKTRSTAVSARSFNIDLETLGLIFRYAQKIKGILLDNPAEGLKRKKETRTRVVIPSREQFVSLLKALQNEYRATNAADLVEFLAYSGCRLGEATEVCWRDINFNLDTLLITGGETGTKNHEERTVPLFPPLKSLLLRLREERRPTDLSGRIFPISHSRQALNTACANLGLPRFGHHTMRHFFCSNCIEAGIDFKTISAWLGHKDGGVLVARTYGHLRAEHSTAMAKRVTFSASAPASEPDSLSS